MLSLKCGRLLASKTLLVAAKSRSAALTVNAIRNFSNGIEESKVRVNGREINCVKTGSGPHPVLLLPGALGCGMVDFPHQIENLDRSKLTLVAWDPPGYGKSRPPDRMFHPNFFERDANLAHELMKVLGFEDFSLIGWSDGAITSLIIAADHPKSVRKLVAIGGNCYVKPSELKIYESIRNIDTWSERMRAPLIAVYGEDYFRSTWSAWVDAMTDICQKNNGDICMDRVPKIRCPTLIVHGARDVLVDSEHPVYLNKHIAGSQLKIFENAGHTLHQRYHKEFNELVTKFLLE